MHIQSGRLMSSEHMLPQDDELVQRVVVRLQIRLGSQLRDFQMSAREDGLILRGKVRTYYGKQMVQEVVMEVSGLSILANDIEVQCFAFPQRRAAAPKQGSFRWAIPR